MEDMQRFLNYKDLFTKCYLDNNSIESEEITKNELEILEDLDPDEVFENLKDLLQSLLYFKRQSKCPESKALETIHSNTEHSGSEDDPTQVLIEENNKLKQINQELTAKIEVLTKSIIQLTAKLAEHEKILKEKTQKKILTQKPTQREKSNEKVQSFTTFKGPATPHRRITSSTNIKTTEKVKMIKSVKFEYFTTAPSPQKPFLNSVGNFLVTSPTKPKTSHLRTTSYIVSTPKSKNP